EAVVHQRPHRVLARRSGAEVGAGDEDRGAGVLSVVEHEVAVVTPFREQAEAEAGALDLLQPVAGDDLVGVDIGPVEGDGGAADHADGFHHTGSSAARSSGVVKCPATAVAAATAGETRWVRPPRPWRPSKLRFDVDAHRSPGSSLSGFIARHIEHPASRHSKPAARKTVSSPSASASAFTFIDPGTTSARRPSRMRRPRTTL